MTLNFRQIHLDFHTSPHIPGIGSKFNADEFADTMQKARVNSVTVFARCHHGHVYYPTKINKERIHPNLVEKDLLGEQIKALHKRNIKAPIYVTIQWDYYTSREHPEWLIVGEQGELDRGLYTPSFNNRICLNSPYKEFIKAHTTELLEMYDADGFFFDILEVNDCSCKYCREGMEKQGLNPSVKADRIKYAIEVLHTFKREVSEVVRKHKKDATIFYNEGHVHPATRPAFDTYSHFEVESLPSGGWGYSHFPAIARYARGLGKEFLGMTGKFHTSWGDFHSFKNQASLEFEVFSALSLNGKSSVGDQLHPNGKISQETYELIGNVYGQVEKVEKWCEDAKAVVDIAVINPEAELDYFSWERQSHTIRGLTALFGELAQQFDIVDKTADLSKYKIVIMPDTISVDGEFSQSLKKYLQGGGNIIASHSSGLSSDGKDFALEEFGLSYKGKAKYSPDYIMPRGAKSGGMSNGLNPTEYVMYEQALEVSPKAGTEVLLNVNGSYFNREWDHFCSHAQTPSSGEDAGYPGVVRSGNIIYFAHPVFEQYTKNAPRWVKILIQNAIDILLPEQVLKHNGPSSIITTINKQDKESRYVLHALHYIPEDKSTDIRIVEDIIPLYNIEFSLKLDEQVKSIKHVLTGEELPFTKKGERIILTLPKIEGYEVYELNV